MDEADDGRVVPDERLSEMPPEEASRDDRADGPPTWLAPVVSSPRPLRQVDAGLASVQDARITLGLSPDGPDHPRGRLWAPVALPAALVDAGAVGAFAITGSALLGVAAAAITVAIGGLVGFIRADPLRITSSQRRVLNQARTWHSRQPWAGPATASLERTLVGRAQQAVLAIVNSRSWWQPEMLDHRARMDLVAELDEIDEQAFRLAWLGPAIDPLPRTALGNRDRGLETYAARLHALDHAMALANGLGEQNGWVAPGISAASTPPALPGPAAGSLEEDETQRIAIAGAVRDEFARDRWAELSAEAELAGRRNPMDHR